MGTAQKRSDKAPHENLWEFIVYTPAKITKKTDIRRSRLLAAMLFFAITLSSILIATRLTASLEYLFYADIFGGVIGIIVGIIAFFVNRAGYTDAAASATIGIFLIIGTFLPFGNSDPTVTTYVLAGIILTGIFFSLRRVLAVAAFVLIAIPIQNGIIYEADFTITFLWWAILLSTALLVTFIYHLNEVERLRRQELEEANTLLRQSEARLEQRVLERTDQLQTAKHETEVALAKALEADRIKSQFLSSMSHELRTPLNSILSFTDLMEMGAFGEINTEQADYLKKISFSGRHLLGLINDVLDISKIESGMMKLFIEDDFDVAAEVQHAQATVEKLIGDKSVQMMVALDGTFPTLTVDKRRVRQVLLNILSNAVKFTEAGTITLRARLDNDHILFAIEDTGPGIAEEQQAIIFEPFEQTEMGMRHAGGTGLGLPISKRLVEAHGGRLWIESQIGSGSTFYFTIPVNTQLTLGETTLQTN